MRSLSTILTFLVCGLLAAGGYAAFTQYQKELVVSNVIDHENLVHGFGNTVWKFHRGKVIPLIFSNNPNIADEVDIGVFGSDVTAYFENIQLPYVYVYAVDGRMLMSITGNEDGHAIRPTSEQISQAVTTRKAVGREVSDAADHRLVMSVVPVVRNGKVEILIVLASDVSAQVTEFIHLLAALLGGMAVVVFIIYIISQWNVRRAENLIAKQFEENADLAAKAALANEENQQKSQFLANITHELRTPLNAIIGFSDILKNEFVPAPGQSHHTNFISDIHSAGTHLLSLINDILDYSKAEAGKLELEVTEVNAVKIVQNCLRLVQPRAEIGHVRLIDSMPKEPIILLTDSKKFKQILLNLLSNAVKFTPPEGTVRVSGWHDIKDNAWVFEVRDSGIGIASKDIARALAPFGQVDNALSRKFEGTGLGLPLTKKFVELMGGQFNIESEPGKGTTVSFALPKDFKAQDGVVVKHVA